MTCLSVHFPFLTVTKNSDSVLLNSLKLFNGSALPEEKAHYFLTYQVLHEVAASFLPNLVFYHLLCLSPSFPNMCSKGYRVRESSQKKVSMVKNRKKGSMVKYILQITAKYISALETELVYHGCYEMQRFLYLFYHRAILVYHLLICPGTYLKKAPSGLLRIEKLCTSHSVSGFHAFACSLCWDGSITPVCLMKAFFQVSNQTSLNLLKPFPYFRFAFLCSQRIPISLPFPSPLYLYH